ncbi:hypothetical protein EKD04_017245 [Chloroflexales bacterium ZM16-3]|nr:hypothetical protein [Chloroflexales bacterium ZM16-3]
MLAQIAALAGLQPGYPDPQIHRDWAEGRQRRKQRYDAALEAVERVAWPEAIRDLESLLAEVPDDREAVALLFHAQAIQAVEERQVAEAAQARQEAEARRQRERLGPVLAQIQAGAFDQAITQLDALLAKVPGDREAAALVAQIIETPAAPFRRAPARR